MKHPAKGNLFEHILKHIKKEIVDVLVRRPGFSIKRILSQGQTTEWLKQDEDEWVVLLAGKAKLLIKDGNRRMSMKPGDYVLIPAGCRHRVAWTDPRQKSVWLAVHYDGTDILETVRKRRSIRKYKKDMPADGDIEKIIEAGRWAPSGLNNQPWRFLVVRDRDKKKGLAKFTKYAAIIEAAPLALVVCMDIADSYNREKDLMAIGACIQNMCLEAHSLGLGTCWLGEILNKKDEAARYLSLDPDLEMMAVLTLGYPDEKPGKPSRRPMKDLKI